MGANRKANQGGDSIPGGGEITASLRQTCLAMESDPSFVAEFSRAQFIEDVLRLMEEQGIGKSDLAKRIGKSRQYVSRILNETSPNFTIDTMAEIACALQGSLTIRLVAGVRHSLPIGKTPARHA